MAMRQWQRVLRLPPASWLSVQLAGLPNGLDYVRQPSCSQSSAPKLSTVDNSRAFSSGYSTSVERTPEPTDIHDYNKLVSTLNFRRRPHLCRDVYEDMLLDGVQPVRDTFYLLVSSCMTGSRLQDVLYFLEEMKTMGLTPDVAIYNCVIAACGRSGQVSLAFQVTEEMEASGIQPKRRTFLTLLRCCAISGRVDEAYEVIRRMSASGLSVDNKCYSALISAHKNRKPYSKDTVQKIFELLEMSKQEIGEDAMAAAAVESFKEQEELDDGLESFLLDDMQSKRGFINRRLVVYHSAVAALSALGNKKAAKEVLKLVEQDGHQIDSYCILQLIKCNLAEGNFEEACAEYNRYVDSGSQPSLELYLVVIEGAIDNASPVASTIAQKLLAEIRGRGFFLNLTLGSSLLQRACKPKTRDVAVATIVWNMMKSRGLRIATQLVFDFFDTLEISGTPKDDPTYLEVKTFLEQEEEKRRVSGVYRIPSVLGQKPEDHGISHEIAEDAPIVAEDAPIEAEDAPIEADGSLETPYGTGAEVGQEEKEHDSQ